MGIPEKARRILDEGKARMEVDTDKRAHFRVEGETEVHSVIFDKSKKRWSCDCRYSALQNKECSHIIACKMLE